MHRLNMVISTAVCFLLSVAVYARLTASDLGVSSISGSKAVQSAVVFVLVGTTLGFAVAAFTRTAGGGAFSLAAIAWHAVAACAVVAGLILASCYLVDGSLGDLSGFLRFEAARIAAVAAAVLAILSYALSRRWEVGEAFGARASQWLRAGTVSVFVLLAVAVAAYVWDQLRPWPVVALKQMLVVVCGVTGPAYILGVLGASQQGFGRASAICGAIVFVVIASVL